MAALVDTYYPRRSAPLAFHRNRFTLPLEIAIRPCIRTDLSALEWFGMFTEYREIIRTTFAAQERGGQIMLLAMAADAPLGQIWIDLESKRRDSIGLLWSLRVFPWFRNQGIGSRLITAAEEAVAAAGLSCAELGVARSNPRAFALYQRLGYRVAGSRRERYWHRAPGRLRRRVYIDELLLRKSLSPEAGLRPERPTPLFTLAIPCQQRD